MMQVSKKIPFEDPQVLMAVRVLYVVSNVLIIGMYLYAQQKINKKKGMRFAIRETSFQKSILTVNFRRYDHTEIR